jgi:ABC-type multidrug transport system ATPase subunit
MASVTVVPAALLLGAVVYERTRGVGGRRGKQWEGSGEPVLSVRNLRKYYGEHPAVKGLDFELLPGVVGLLGPNGAGKTTLLAMLAGYRSPTRGSVQYRGVVIGESNRALFRERVGLLPQEFSGYDELRGLEFLDYWALNRGQFGDVERSKVIKGVLRDVGLEESAGRRVGEYSGGMRRRLGLAQALVSNPEVIILDEPTTGVDTESRARFKDLVRSLATSRIVVLSTHTASDLTGVADRVMVLREGSLLFDGVPGDLLAYATGRVVEIENVDRLEVPLKEYGTVTSRTRGAAGLQVRIVLRKGISLGGIVERGVTPTLEEAYLALMSDAGSD